MRRNLRVAAGAVVAAALLVWGAYLSVAVPTRWFARADTLQFEGAALALANGVGSYRDGALVVTSADANGVIVVSVNTDFASGNYPGVEWHAEGIPADADVRLVWRSDTAGKRTNLASIPLESGAPRPLTLNRDPAWNGRIKGLALAIRLPVGRPLTPPVRVIGVTASPMSALDVVRARVREWYAFEPFNGTTINTITGGADSQNLPLPLLAATVVALAALILAAVHRWLPARYSAGSGVTLAALFMVAWLAVDARWAWNLAQQTRATVARYGGKTPDERHLAAEDGALFAFITKARAVMPATPARVFVGATAHYFRGRAAYHLYPHNVQFEAFRDTLAPAAMMRPGDWIVVFQRQGMHYDPDQRTLQWDGGPPLPVDLKLVDEGGAVFVVR